MRLTNAVPSDDPREFLLANMCSPVVHAAGREGGGALFTLADMRRFELNAADVNAMGMPIWGEAE